MKNEHSIAAIVFYKDDFLLLKYEIGHWGLVKGNVEKGESKEETILRELEEETGIRNARILDGFEEHYEYYYRFKGELIHKTVDCLLIETKTKNIELSYEHIDFDWVSYEEALNKMSFENTRKILRKAKKFLSSRINRFLS